MRKIPILAEDVLTRVAALARLALRAGVDAIDRSAKTFTTAGMNLGSSLVGSLDDVNGALARAEADTVR